MLISAHFPLPHLKRGLRYVDFPFILGHLWHRQTYRNILEEHANTFAIVDNGVHERGEPISSSKIADILDRNPGWIGILPDSIHKPIWTWSAVIRTMQRTGLDLGYWGIVLHGNSREHIHFQHDLAIALGAGLICFPFRASRWDYLKTEYIDFQQGQRYHLMGLNEKDTLGKYSRLPGKWSLDSTKIFKCDLRKPNWHSRATPEKINWTLVQDNISYLREITYGGST